MIDVHIGTLAQAYTCDIANESLNYDMTLMYWAGSYVNWINWLQHHDVGLPKIGWHDRRGQHDCVLGRTCLYAPCCWVAWQMRSSWLLVGSDVSICTILLGGMTDVVSTVTCWIGCAYMHHRDWVAWQTRSAQLRVRSDVFICTNPKIWIVENQAGNV